MMHENKHRVKHKAVSIAKTVLIVAAILVAYRFVQEKYLRG